MRTRLPWILLAVIALTQTGCAAWTPFWKKPKVNYQTVQANPHRDTELAEQKTADAVRLMEKGKLEKADAALQEALVADVRFGPAHNNLGTVYFRQRKYYLAAWEYEYAIRLMPDRAEPYNNLGLVYDAAEKPDRAIEMFEAARQLDARNPEYLANLTRALVRRDGPSAAARSLLEELLFLETRPEWTCWAREQLALGKHPTDPVVAAGTTEVLPSVPAPVVEPIPLPSAELPPSAPVREAPSREQLPAPPSARASDEAI